MGSLKLAEEIGARFTHQVTDGMGGEHSLVLHVSFTEPPGLRDDRVAVLPEIPGLKGVDVLAACRAGVEGALRQIRKESGGLPPPLQATVLELVTREGRYTADAITYAAWSATLSALSAATWTEDGKPVEGDVLSIPRPPKIKAGINIGIRYELPR